MASLIEQLQREALDPGASVVDILRKAKLVAAKLDREDALRWLEDEMRGYAPEREPPEYRAVVGHPQYHNPYHGWQEIHFADPQDLEKLTDQRLHQPVAEIEALARDSSEGTLLMPFPPELVRRLERSSRRSISYASLGIDRSQLLRILSALRDRVLDWTVALQKAGVRGEGEVSFSEADRQAAAGVTYNISIQGDVHGSVGTVSGGTVNVTQCGPETIAALSSLVGDVRRHVSDLGLDAQARTDLESRLSELEHYLKEKDPDPTVLGRVLVSIRSISEKATGSLLATGILHVLSKPEVAALIQRAFGG